MVRKVMLTAAVLLLVMTGIASARPGPDVQMALQDTAEADETPMFVESLVLGERYSNGLFDLEIQDAFWVDSPLYPAYDEVRLSVAFRHHTDVPWLPSQYAFTGEYGYPKLQLVDSAGEIHDIPTNVIPLWVEVVQEAPEGSDDTAGESTPTRTLNVQLGEFGYNVGGYSLSMQPRGIPARWTVGFRLPSTLAADLVVQASFGGQVVAEWDLETAAIGTQGWDRPAGFDLAELGDSIVWNESLLLEPRAVATEVCGDPQYGHTSVNTSMLLGVSSVADRDALFPDVRYPQMTAIAVWEDGTAARYSEGSIAYYDDDTEAEIFDRSLLVYGEHIVVPPHTDNDVFLEFVAPRDGRFADITSGPVAIVLYPPDGSAIWVDVTGAPTGSIAEFECSIPTFHLFPVNRDGAAPQPPAPSLQRESVFDG
jgi:hypothetical protein